MAVPPVSKQPHESPEEELRKRKKRKRSRVKKAPAESDEAPEVKQNEEESEDDEEKEVVKDKKKKKQQIADVNEDESDGRKEEHSKGEDGEAEGNTKKKKVRSGGGIMSTDSFDSLELSEPTRKAIREMGFHFPVFDPDSIKGNATPADGQGCLRCGKDRFWENPCLSDTGCGVAVQCSFRSPQWYWGGGYLPYYRTCHSDT